MNVAAPLLTAPPTLAPRFLEPAGLRWGRFTAADGVTLRWAHLAAAKATANCVLLGGFTEFIEKYFETLRDLSDRGLAVWCLDWRDQGGSERSKRTIPRDFDRDAADLTAFIEAHVPKQRRLVVAHSMGSAITLLALHENPKLADAAVLSAPMIEPTSGGLPRVLARVIPRLAVALGLGGHFIPAGPASGPWRYDDRLSGENSIVSHDAERCLVHRDWFENQARLRVDGPTFAWAKSAFALSSRLLAPGFLAAISTPILIGSAGKEFLVRPESHQVAAARLPHCKLVEFPTAKHELFHETDHIRNRWLGEIDAFIAARFTP